MPTVAAVREYEARHGYPPVTLADAGLPAAAQATGLGAYPAVAYEVQPAQARVFGNRWMLRVEAFNGSGWDQLIYLPNGRYPRVGFGGAVKRLGDWAYVRD